MNICVVITMINYFIVCHSMVGTTKPMDNYTLFEFLEVRSWPRADKLTGPKVCCERTADIVNSILYESTGSRSKSSAPPELTQPK
ncbi:hypothetical protein CH426_24385 [Klebsiella aerogenes]|nr:hypothetical protein CH426_24385 [Klebsiella aerogenes]